MHYFFRIIFYQLFIWKPEKIIENNVEIKLLLHYFEKVMLCAIFFK